MRMQLMKCPHGRTMERGCKHCEPPHVTVTGRAVSPGRVTRASTLVRTRAKGDTAPPLPAHLACHPKALTRTTRNPGCLKKARTPHRGLAIDLKLTRDEMREGKLLMKRKRRFAVRSTTLGKILGYTDDVVFALAYTLRALGKHVHLEVIDNGP